ncbi:InlB B-repeat-containing protein [Draconibacterium mangrovi]|uniref:InlB B-repeat-containing protein n=1 Tax=Draconibacterium mangrovi TaxID=2697469 RepID=UPI0013D432F8|nr:InlB B-repeat-containing protein [Draconibacterium mangrovi]
MKRALLIMFLINVFICNNTLSQEVSKTEISNIANKLSQKSYFQQNKLKSGQTVNIERMDSIVVDGTTIGYMVYYSPEGFSLIPKFRELTPEFAFSGEGDFSSNADNFIVDFLSNELKLRYKALKDNKIPQSRIEKNKTKWNDLSLKNATIDESYQIPLLGSSTTGGLIQTSWYQSGIFNDYCPNPEDQEEEAVVGCAATAMAQVVNYWGEITGNPMSVSFSSEDNYTTRTNEWFVNAVDASISNLSYPLSTVDQGRLSYACGVSLQMNYTYTGSGAHFRSTALTDKFRFTNAERLNYDGTFASKLRSNIENGMPCLLAIYKDDGSGHGVICDGFLTENGSTRFHFNYGWKDGPYAKEGSEYFYEIPDGLPANYTSISYGIVDIFIKGGGSIDKIECDNIYSEKSNTLKVNVSVVNGDNYYVGIWNQNETDKPLWEWEQDYSSANLNIGSECVFIDSQKENIFTFDFVPTSESQVCNIYLYRETLSGVYTIIDKKEVNLNVIIDNDPPVVTQTNFTSDITTDINLIFSEKMDINTVTSANINLVGSNSGIHTFGLKYSDSSNLMTLEPVIDFDYNEDIIVTLSTGIKDMAGNSLDGDNNGTEGPNYTLTFTTDDGNNSLTEGEVNNETGTTKDDFQFSVIYADESGLSPQQVNAVIEGISYAMSGSGDSPSSGETYTYTKNFSSMGDYDFHFEAISNSGGQLRFPASGELKVNVNESVNGWDMVTNEISATPKYMLDAQNVSVSVEYVNMSDSQDKIYYNLPYKFEMFSPNGDLEDSESGTIAQCPKGSILTKSVTLTPNNIDGSHQIVFTVYPDKDVDNTNNSKSIPVIIGADGPTREYYVKSEWREVKMDAENQSVTFEGHTYTIQYIGNGKIEISQDGGSQKDIDTEDFREYNSYTDVLICEYINTVGDAAAWVSFGSSESGVVEYTSTNVSGYPGESVFFTGTCNGTTFNTWSPNIYRNVEIDDWYKDVDLFNSNKTAEYEFEIPNNTPAGVYEFYMGAELSGGDYFLRMLSITVLDPLPSITSLSENSFCGNDIITINGTNFGTQQGTIKFNSLSSSTINSWSNTSIQCTVPSGIEAGNIYVINSAGTSNGFSFSIGTMDSPENILASDGTYCDRVNISWDALSSAYGYNVYRNNEIIASNIASTSFDDYDANSTSSSYSVSAIGDCGESNRIYDAGYKTPKSQAPTYVVASDGTYCDKVNISWNDVYGAVSYNVYRGNIKIGNEITQTNFEDIDAPTVQTEYYVTTNGNCGESDKTSDSGFRAPEISAPNNVQASDGIYCDKVRITWDEFSEATSYNIYKDDNMIASNIVNTTYDYYDATSNVATYSVSANGFCGESSKASDTGNKCIINLPDVAIISTSISDASCNSSSDGEITINYSVILENGNIFDKGVCWSESGNPSIDGNFVSQGAGEGIFEAIIENLEAGTYNVCSYAENEAGIEYSQVEEVHISEPDLVQLINYSISQTSNSFTLSNIEISGGIAPYQLKVVGTPDASSFNQGDAIETSPLIYDGLDAETTYNLQFQITDANGCTIVEEGIQVVTDSNITDPEIELKLYRISDTSGGSNTSNPGTIKSEFQPGETARITFSVSNSGGAILPLGVLNLFNKSGDVIYDTHQVDADNSYSIAIDTQSGTVYMSFDWTVPANLETGNISVGAAIRDQNNWETIYDETSSGPNTIDFSAGWILEDQLSVIARTYTITFVDWNGTVLKTEEVAENGSATAPANPTRDGYTFTGWDVPFDNITSDLTVTAQYSQNVTMYTVSFVDWNGTELHSQTVAENGSATAPADPTREGYTFTGWNVTFDNITSDLTVTAQYTANPITYTVTFVDWDNNVLKTDEVTENSSATAPDNPTRDGYSFTGWDVAFNNITSDLTVTALYLPIYTVTFVNGDSTVIKMEEVAENGSATAPADPTLEGRSFLGWDVPFDNITSDLTITALYDPPVSVEELMLGECNLYPNPSEGELNIEFNKLPLEEIKVTVLSIDGTKVLQKTYQPTDKIVIDMSEHVSGMYLVKVSTFNTQEIKKLILNKN